MMGRMEDKAGEASDLWDDSALLDAFSQAMSKYKNMHGVGKGVSESKKEELDAGDGDHTSGAPPSGEGDRNKELEVQASQHDPMKESFMSCSNDKVVNKSLEVQNDQYGQESSTSELLQEVSLENKTVDDSAEPNVTKISQLLRQYYELEEKRQSVLGQLHEAGYRDDQAHAQGYYDPCSQQNLCWSASHAQHEPAEKTKGEFDAVGRCESTEIQNVAMDKDLLLVINSWYSAGFYTGRYVTLQSSERNHV